MIRFGVNPIVWSNDDLERLGGQTPLEQCLREARAAGYDGIELGHKFPRRAAVLRPLLAAHGLALVSGWHSGYLGRRDADAEIEALAAHAELLGELGARVLIFAECHGSVHGRIDAPHATRPRLDDAGWKRLAEGLNRVGAHLAKLGLGLAYHHHIGTVVQTEAEVDRLMALTAPDVGLLLDTGHLIFAGGDPLAVIDKHARRIVHVHCKDVRTGVLGGLDAGASFLDAVCAGAFTVPGDGAIAFAPILEALARHGYDGWLVVEADQDPQKAPPLEFAAKGGAHLKAAARAAGLG